MQIAGLSIADGRVSLLSVHEDGLHLSGMGLDPRGTNDFGSGEDITEGALAHLVVTPTPLTLPTGSATYTFTAYGFDASWNPLTIVPVWSFVGTPVATINSSTGVLTSSATPETVTVRATVGALTANATVTISVIVLDSLVVSPGPTWEMAVSQTRLFSAIGYAGGTAVSITPTWSVVSGVGTIDATGLYTAGFVAGSAVIRATYGAVSSDVTITVNMGTIKILSVVESAPTIVEGGQASLSVRGSDKYGNIFAFATQPYAGTISWTVSEGGSITPTGAVVTLTAGPVDVQQTYPNAVRVAWNGLEAFIGFTVTPTA